MHAPRTRVGKLGDFLKTYFAAPLQLKPFRNVVGMYLFAFMAQDAVLALAVYLMTHVLGIPSMMTLLIPVYGTLIVAVLLMRIIAAKLGKRRTYMISALLWLAALSIVFVMREGMPMLYLYIFGVLFGFGLAGVQVTVFAMFPDVPDADEFLSGARREGIFSGIFAFARKSGGAFTLFIIGLLIDAAGYKPAVDSVSQVQTAEFKLALRFIFFALPGLYLIGALWAARTYSLTRERMEQIRQIIRYRKSEPGRQGPHPVSPEIEGELRETLGGTST
jgi:Na+/melibiose symporter-like transporter